MHQGKNRRQFKNFLINPRFQLRYVFWTTFTGLFLVTVNAAVFYYFTRENYKILVDLSPMEENVKAQLYKELYQIIVSLGGFAFVFTLVTAFIGIVLSHKTAGPMINFKRVFREIRDGNVGARVRLRPGDDFRDVADEFNRMVDAILKK